MLFPAFPQAIFALADGTVFIGQSVGFTGQSVGEVVFNTSMTGYQEILTDPSYSQQMVTLTYPHIGNVGCNPEDFESKAVHAAALIIKDASLVASNFRSTQSLSAFLNQHKVVGIAGIDTRALTQLLRSKGSQNGAILVADATPENIQKTIEMAKSFAGLVGRDLAKVVSTPQSYEWTDPEWSLTRSADSGDNNIQRHQHPQRLRVAVLDFGVKHNILRMLVSRGCDLTVYPAQTPFDKILESSPDGIFLSNGPGDPEPCDYAIRTAQSAMSKGLPLFGICLGHQILALASGAKTYKMKFGHHGANHPVQRVSDGRVFITSQNHGFAVNPKDIPSHLEVTHVSLFDGSVQGIARKDCPAFGFQGHPEASPGPHDVAELFDQFVCSMMKR